MAAPTSSADNNQVYLFCCCAAAAEAVRHLEQLKGISACMLQLLVGRITERGPLCCALVLAIAESCLALKQLLFKNEVLAARAPLTAGA